MFVLRLHWGSFVGIERIYAIKATRWNAFWQDDLFRSSLILNLLRFIPIECHWNWENVSFIKYKRFSIRRCEHHSTTYHVPTTRHPRESSLLSSGFFELFKDDEICKLICCYLILFLLNIFQRIRYLLMT